MTISRALAGPLLLAVALSSCGERRNGRTPSDLTESADADPNKGKALKASYSAKDMTGLKLIPTSIQGEPWKLKNVYLVGTFPDDSQGRVLEGVEWSVAKEDVAKIGPKNGTLIPQAEGDVSLSAKFNDKVYKTSATFKFSRTGTEVLGEPESFAGTEPTATGDIKLTWKLKDEKVSDVLLSYKVAANATDFPPVECADGTGVTVVSAEDIEKETEAMLTGLAAGDYSFRICSRQVLSSEGVEVQRVSDGVTLKKTVPAAP